MTAKRGFDLGILNRLQWYGDFLVRDPIGFVIYMLYLAVSVLLTLTLHEVAHGYVAYRCGDPTAKMLGRLSLDPRKHLDPIGTAMLFVLGFGWAKPVPVNPRNFKNYRRDDFLVSVAGVTVNFTLFLLSTGLAVALNGLLWKPDVMAYFGGAKALVSSTGPGAAILLSGFGADYAEFMRMPWLQHIQRFLLLFSTMNLGIGIFNLLPIPPLDGFHIANDLLLKGRLRLDGQAFEMTRMILMLLMFTGALGNLLSTVRGAIENGVLNLFFLIAGQA